MNARAHPAQSDSDLPPATDAATVENASARARKEARRNVAILLSRALDSRGIVDKVAAAWCGVKRQTLSQYCRPGGVKNIGVAEASLLRDDEVRQTLAQFLVGAAFRVVRAPLAGVVVAADIGTAGRLIRRHAALLDRYIAAHEDGELTPAEKRDLKDLIQPLVDDLVGLDHALSDELPGERR